MLGNTGVHYSKIMEHLYDLQCDPEYMCGLDLYSPHLLDAMADYIVKNFPAVEWSGFEANGLATICWVENGHLHMEAWDIFYMEEIDDDYDEE